MTEKTVQFSRKRARTGPKGRTATPESRAEVRTMLNGAPLEREFLLENLHCIQDSVGFLSARHLAALAAEMKMSMAEVYEAATFYHHFSVVKEGETPPPELTVRVCDSLSCEMAGARELLSALRAGGDLAKMRVVRAPCVGRCAEAPVAVVGHNPISRATADSVLSAIASGETKAEIPSGATGFAAYRKGGGYRLYSALASGETRAEDVIRTLEDSGLRGLGGAGFPAGRKWGIVRGMTGAEKVVAVNIDEGEPGTFKDRFYLERDPHRFVEGALIASAAIGAGDVYVYLRDEYHGCRALLERELELLRTGRIFLCRGFICGGERGRIFAGRSRR